MKGLIFTYGLTYGGALVALFKPYYGFLVYVCFGILRPPAMWPWSVGDGNYSRTIAIGLLAGWVLHGLGSWQFGRARALVISLLVFWGMTFVSTLQAPHADTAWLFFDQISKILLPVIIGVTLIDSVVKLQQLVWVIAISQGLVALEMNQSYFSGYNRLYFDGFASLDSNAAAITMVAGAGLTFFLALHARKLWQKGLAGMLFLLMTHAIMFSFSRGAMLSLMTCGVAALAILPKRPLYLGGFLLAVMLGVRMAGPEVLARFATTFASEENRDYSAASRIDLWKACLSEMLDNPITGLGPDHWKFVAHHHGFDKGKAAHSTWMQTAAEGGVITVTSLLLFYLLCITRLWPLTFGPEDDPLVAIARMVVCSLCGFVLAAQFVSVNLVEISYYVATAGMGVLKLTSLPQYALGPDAACADWRTWPVETPAYAMKASSEPA